MVRAPTKTCPNLHRLLTEAPIDLLARFLSSRQFKMLGWVASYAFSPDDPGGRAHAAKMLMIEPKATLGSLEAEATRIVTIAGNRGQYVLEGLLRDSEDESLSRVFLSQGDELSRSLWAWLDSTLLFEAAENVLHLRLYRRYDKHYQTFAAMPVNADTDHANDLALKKFVEAVEAGLNRGAGCSTDRFDIPADGDEPAAEMYIFRHPNLPTAAREIDESGNVSRFYFRPPGEAMVVFVPSTGRVHVRADTRAIRHIVWKAFVSKALEQDLSHQPVDFQAYDLARFLKDYELPLSNDQATMVKQANVIRLEASIGSLSNRISVATTIRQGVRGLIEAQPGLDRIFANAVAIRFVEIALRYRRAGQTEDKILDFTISDANTSSLMSLDDHFEQALAHRLLKEWGILVEGRAPAKTDFHSLFPAILALWDDAAEWVSGSWLARRNLDPQSLLKLGFLVPQGWEEEDLIDDDIGSHDARIGIGPDGTDLGLSEGQGAPGGSPDLYRRYRVRPDWVFQYLKQHLVSQFGSRSVDVVTPNLLALGAIEIAEKNVPVYMVRRLRDERSHAETDTALRLRSNQGTGLVLNAGHSVGYSLAANVLLSFGDYSAAPSSDDIEGAAIDLDGLRAAFYRHRNLAQGGETVQLEMTGEHAGTLVVPGRGTIDIVGEHRLLVINRLVSNCQESCRPMKTEDMIKGISDQSLANIFGKDLWDKLKSGFLRTPRKGSWEIAV